MDFTPSIFLSPHLDDAALSCGGMIHQLAQAGQAVQVVTLFAGDPLPGPLTPFARGLHRRWQAGVADRRREDIDSLTRLGAQAVHLPYLDAIYRLDPATGAALYDSEESIFGEVAPADALLIESIIERLRAIDPAARLIVPLTAGHHVDHQIARRTAESLGRELIYYEDYPYAEMPARLEAALGGRKWKPELIHLDDAAIRAKAAAIWAHRSQMSTFFASEAEMAQRVRTYAELVGGEDGPCERLWR